MGTYLILILPILLLSMFVQWKFRTKFSKYSELQLSSALSGKEVAEQMLHDHNIYDVKILSLEGQLTDHYNPSTRTVNLSTDVYYGRSIAANDSFCTSWRTYYCVILSYCTLCLSQSRTFSRSFKPQ